MSVLISWAFGWIIGLGAPILIAAVSLWLLVTSPMPVIRQIALNALIVAACWGTMTLVTQSAVTEALRKEQAAYRKGEDAERGRQSAANDEAVRAANARLVISESDNAQLESQIDAYEATLAATPACRATPADVRGLSDLLR
jgi:hypothetical protein